MKLVPQLVAALNTKAGRIARRVAGTFVFAFLAQLVASGWFTIPNVTNVSIIDKAAVAGAGTVLALVQSLASQWLAGEPTVLALIQLLTPAGRAAAHARRLDRHLARVRSLPARRRYGKLPARSDAAVPWLDRHLSTAIPAPAVSLHWTTRLVIAWGMMLNDRIGDCTCAAVGHAIQLMTGLLGRLVTLADAVILKLYCVLSGYDPCTGTNDNGCVEADVLAYWLKHGVGGHNIVAYGRVDQTNATVVKQVISLFGFAYIGTQVPAAWEQAPAVWDVPHDPAGSKIVGGHAVILVGYDEDGYDLISWGQLFRMTNAAFAKYVDEVWGVVSSDWVKAHGTAPSGIDLQAAIADMQALEQAA